MKLVRLSIYSIWGCLLGLAGLAGVALMLDERIQEQDAQIGALFDLRERLSDFITGSESLLFFGADQELLGTYLHEGALIQDRLRALSGRAPKANKGIQRLTLIMENVQQTLSDLKTEDVYDGSIALGPLGLNSRSRIIINSVMNHSIALDTVLDQLIIDRRETIALEREQIRLILGATALLFGVLCVIAFGVIYRRVGRPVHELATTIGLIEQGHHDRRAQVRGNDEFAELAQTLNSMLDRNHNQEVELRRSNEWLVELLTSRQALINSLPANIALVDQDGVILEVNERWREFGRENGLASGNVGIGINYLELCTRAADADPTGTARETADALRRVLAGAKEQHFSLEYPCDSPTEARWFRLTINRLDSDETQPQRIGAVIMHLDITEQKVAQREMERLANRDGLTGLLSRGGFTRAFSEQIHQQGWPATAVVVILDIIGQRNVNDAHGYDTGDQLLIRFGERIAQFVGNAGFVGRIGGAEFVISLSDNTHENLDQTLMELRRTIETPFELGRVSLDITARMGFTRLRRFPRKVENLIREAELALFQNSYNHARPWLEFTNELDRQVHERVEIARELRIALETDQLELHFQPKVDLRSGHLVSCEALIRWNHPQRGLLPPGVFIPVAEQSQLIGAMGTWTIRQACRHLRDWKDAGLDIVRVAVNVSLVQFQLEDLTTTVDTILKEFGVEPSALSLEITESVFEHESRALNDQLTALHRMGVRLSLDDFGTGYSSLLYLQQYPFDEIKIDKGFVQRIETDVYSRKIVDTVMGLAGALGAEVVAEGVETESMRDALLELGCRWAQGFYYSFPLESEDFRWLLEKRSSLPLSHTRTAGTIKGNG